MNTFDIIGPIMIGPSSSHTAGVVRIGLFCKSILNIIPKNVSITWYGSFAKTYVGHGSDKAIIAGLLGLNTDDENIIDSFEIAKSKGMKFSFEASNEETLHPNTVKVVADNDKGNLQEIWATSVGGGRINVVKIDDTEVLLDGKYDTLFTNHVDQKGVIKDVASLLYDYHINVATMKVHRSEKSGNATMTIETDSELTNEVLDSIKKIESIRKAVIIPKF